MKHGASHPSAHAGLQAFQLRDFPTALRCFQDWIAQEPDNVAGWNFLGLAQRELGLHNAALDSFDRAIEADPADGAAVSHKGRCLSYLNRHDEAVACLLDYVSDHPESGEDLDCLGSSLLALGRLEEALGYYDRAISCSAARSAFHSNHGACLFLMKRFEDAAESLRKALTRDPNNLDALYNFANTAIELSRSHEAARAARRYLKMAPLAPAHRVTRMTELLGDAGRSV